MKKEYKYVKKDKAGDPLIAQLIQRPLVKPLVMYLAPRKISPDVISALGVLVSFLGVCGLFVGKQLVDFFSALLLQIGNLLDCVDGDLARTRGKAGSLSGKYMDYLKAHMADLLVPLGLAGGVARYFENEFIFFVMAILCIWKIAPQITREHVVIRSLETDEELLDYIRKDVSLITDIQREVEKGRMRIPVKILKSIVGLPNSLPNTITFIAIAGFFIQVETYNVLKLILTFLVIVTYLVFSMRGVVSEYNKLKAYPQKSLREASGERSRGE